MATVMAALLPDPDDPAGAADPDGADVLELDPVLLLDEELHAAARTATVPRTAAPLSAALRRGLTSETFTTTEHLPPDRRPNCVRAP